MSAKEQAGLAKTLAEAEARSAIGTGATLPPSTRSTRPRRRWSVLRRVLWLVILVLGVLTYLWVLHVMVDTRNINFFPSLLLIGAITVPLSVLAFAEGGGRRIAVAPWVLITAVVAGGIVGTIIAGVLEYDALTTLGFQALLAAGSIGAVDQTLLLRALLAPASHIAWTGLTVAALWRIRTAPRRGQATFPDGKLSSCRGGPYDD